MKKFIILVFSMFLFMFILYFNVNIAKADIYDNFYLLLDDLYELEPGKVYPYGVGTPYDIYVYTADHSSPGKIEYNWNGETGTATSDNHNGYKVHFCPPTTNYTSRITLKIRTAKPGSQWTEEKTFYFDPMYITAKLNGIPLQYDESSYSTTDRNYIEVHPGDEFLLEAFPSKYVDHLSFFAAHKDPLNVNVGFGIENFHYDNVSIAKYIFPELKDPTVYDYIVLSNCNAYHLFKVGNKFAQASTSSINFKFKVTPKEEEEEPLPETISVSLTKGASNVKATAKVENGTFKNFSYSWDGASYKTSTNNPLTIDYPTNEGTHTLNVYATTTSGIRSATKSITYVVEAPVEETIAVTLVKSTSNVKATATVENGTFKNFSYSWDGASYTTSTSNPLTIAYPTTVGSHTLKVYAVTSSGLKSTTKTITYEVEPQVEKTITVTISKKDNYAIATATVENGTFKQFSYAWDGGSSKTSTANPVYIDYPTSAGSHTLNVYATTTTGKKSATKSITYEVAAPAVESITVTLAKNTNSAQATATVENGTFKNFSYSWDGASYKTSTSNPLSIAYPTSVGSHTLNVYATTTTGKKSATKSITYEVVATAVESITVTLAKNTNSAQATATVENGTFKNFSYSWDGASYKTSTSNPLSIAYPTTEGKHTLKVYATTNNGKTSAIQSLTYEVAVENITVTLTKNTNNVEAKATVENGTFNEFSYSWDGKTVNKSSNNPLKISYPTAEGNHTLNVYATTKSGKKSTTQTISYEVVKQQTAEETITVALTKNTNNIKATATVANGTFKQLFYSWDNGYYVVSTSNPLTIPYPTAEGNHTLIVYATTNNGKESSKQTLTYEVAKQQPAEETIKVTLSKNTDNVVATATVSNGTFKQFFFSWDNDLFVMSTSNPLTISYPTSEGKHSLRVYASTNAGKDSDVMMLDYEVIKKQDSEEKITINLSSKESYIVAEANVENGAFKQFSYSWDNESQRTSTTNPTNIDYPTTVGNHTLVVYAVTQNGKQSEAKSLSYEVKQTTEEISISAKITGKDISEDTSKPTSIKLNDSITIEYAPSNMSVTYCWDAESTQELSNNKITVPSFKDNNTHKLTVIGKTENSSLTKVFYVCIPNEYELDLQVDSWMEENENAGGVLISLRNRSENSKANQNYYMLDEEVIYLVDYKNAGKAITDEVKVELKLPLSFEVVDSADGNVDLEKKTITWTYNEGLEKNAKDTRTVIVKYKALNKKSDVSEMVYPQAIIYKNNQNQDTSSVINCIYLDDNTLFDESHAPYMLGDQGKATFRPDDSISRAEGALVLMRIFGEDYKNITKITTKLSDIDDTYLEAQKAITKATELGIINGYPDGTYRPNKKMTKAEFMKIIAAYIETNAEVEGLEVRENTAIVMYKNTNENVSWAVPYVTLLVRLNMTPASNSQKDLKISDDITRAEVTQLCNFFLFRAPVKVTSNTNSDFEDVSRSHKLFSDIVEATREEHEYTVTSDGKERIK